MKKIIFCLQCKSPMSKIKPLTGDMLTAQKVFANQLQFFQNKSKTLLFNQWKCKCDSNIITID